MKIAILSGAAAAVWAFVGAMVLFDAPPAVTVNGRAVTPANARERFAVDLLARLGNTAPSADTIGFVVSWTMAEDAGDGALARNNPLNTTQVSGAETMVINSDGVRGYADYASGLDATVATLTNGLYDDLVRALVANDPSAALAALVASPWDAAHYPHGLPQYTVASPASDIRQAIITDALAQLGKPYVLGTQGPDTFDCSGFVHWLYARHGIETTRTTFTQLDALQPIEVSDLLPGDLIYQQFPSDQHVVMWAGDLDGDGKGDVIEAGGYLDGPNNVNVLSDFFGSHPIFTSAIIGYRRAL